MTGSARRVCNEKGGGGKRSNPWQSEKHRREKGAIGEKRWDKFADGGGRKRMLQWANSRQ